MAALIDIVKKGSTDRSVTLKAIDSTDGTPETGFAYNTAGIDLWYRREGATKTSITEADLAALDTAHTDGGVKHIGDGEFRLDAPDAAFATGANYVDFGGTATGMIVIGGRVRLVDYDIEFDASGGLPSNGMYASGTLSGTHSSTTADLGTAAPAKNISGMTLYVPARALSAIIDSYDTGTGIATFSPSTTETLTNGDVWYVHATPKASTGSPVPADVTKWNGTAVATPTVAGVPEIDLTHIAGAAVSTTTAQLGVNVEKINNVDVVGAGTSGDKWRA